MNLLRANIGYVRRLAKTKNSEKFCQCLKNASKNELKAVFDILFNVMRKKNSYET
jgi:hypothetical protein